MRNLQTRELYEHQSTQGIWLATLLLLFFVGLANRASATMIVIVYTEDGLWLGADGYRSTGDEHLEDVCKIHQTKFGLIAKSGTSQGFTYQGVPYSTDKEVEELLAQANDLNDFQIKLRNKFKT